MNEPESTTDDLARRSYRAIQTIRGLDPAQPPPEPNARVAWQLETDGGSRHPLDVVSAGSLDPALAKLGFIRDGRTWNRRTGNLVHVVNLQASKFNVLTRLRPVLFHVNLGVFIPMLRELVWAEPPPQFVKEYQCQLRRQLHALTRNRADLILSLEQDRSLEQQGEELTRQIVEIGVGYLDRAASLEALDLILAEDMARGLLPVDEFTQAYVASCVSDQRRAASLIHQVHQGVGKDPIWGGRVARLAAYLGIDLPELAPPPPVPTFAAAREGVQRLRSAMLRAEDIGSQWQPGSTGAGHRRWPALMHHYQARRAAMLWAQLSLELTHYADIPMAERAMVEPRRLADQSFVEDLGDGLAVREAGNEPTSLLDGSSRNTVAYTFRVGPVIATVSAAALQTSEGEAQQSESMKVLDLLVQPIAERQAAQLQLLADTFNCVLAVAGANPEENAAATLHVTGEADSASSRLIVHQREASAWRLEFADCAGIHNEEDVCRTLEQVAAAGLVPTLGPAAIGHTPTLVSDISDWMRLVHLESDVWKRWKHGKRNLSRTRTMEHWSSAALGRGLGWKTAQLGIERAGRDNWRLTVWLSNWQHSDAGFPLDRYAESWATLLLRLVDDLRSTLRPKLTILFASESYTGSTDDLERGALLVGWRTWYGPAQVEQFGREFLLGLPDSTHELEDGTISHSLDVSPVEMVLPRSGRYARLREYVRAHPVELGWPRL